MVYIYVPGAVGVITYGLLPPALGVSVTGLVIPLPV